MMDTRQHTKIGEELKREKKFSQNIIATIPDSLLVLDKDLRVKSANRSFYRLFQTEPEKVMGSKIGDILGDKGGKLSAELTKLFGTEDTLENFELYYQSEKLGQRIFNITARGMIVAEEEEEEEEEVVVVLEDITEQKRAKKALEESEKKYRSLVNNVKLGIFRSTPEPKGKFLEVNPAMEEITGYSRKELLQINVSDLYVYPEEREVILEEVVSARGKTTRELRFRKKDGTEIMVSDTKFAVRDDAGKILYFDGILEDITERKQTEEEIKQLKEYLQLQIERMPIALIVWDVEFRVQSWNPAAEDMFGFTMQEALGKHPYNLIVPKEAQLHVDDIWRRLLEGDTTAHSVNENITKDGRTIICQWSNTPLKKADGTVVGVLSMVQDISERKRMEEELQMRAQFLDAASDSIFVYDFDGNLVYLNEMAYKSHGYSKDELMAMNRYDLLTPESARLFDSGIKDLKRNEETVFESVHLRKDGSTFPVEIHARIIETDGKNLILGICRDITERKKAEAELVRLSSAVKMSTDSIVISDLEANIIDANEATLKMYGTDDKRDLIGKNSLELIAPKEREKALEGMTEVLEKGYVKSLEYHIITKDGSTIPVEMSVAIMEDADGKPIGFVAVSRDITERKQAEEALKQSEERYRTILEETGDGYFETDLAGSFTLVNDALCRLLGYSMEEMVGMNYKAYTPEKNVRTVFEAYNRIYRTREPMRDFPYEVVRKDGSRGFAETTVFPVRDAKGEIIGFRGIRRDITERKRVEEALRVSEERYRTLFETNIDGLCVMDETMKVLLVNEAAARIFGFDSAEEALGVNPFDFIPPQERERVLETITKDMFENDKKQVNEFRLVNKAGKEVWISTVGAVIEYQGKPAGLISFRDVTEQKQADETLRQSEEKYRTILSEMQDNYFEVDLAGNLTFFNDSASNSLGYSAEELMGMSYREFTASEDIKLVYKIVNKVYRTNRPNEGFSWKVVRKDGTIGFVEATVSLLRNPKGEIIGFRGVGRDITERKRAEEERRQLEQKAQVTSRLASVGEMAAGVAHEINNPLTGVIGYAQLLMDRKDIPSDIRRDLAAINEGAQRVAGIVKRLLVFSRQVKPERRDVDINELIESTLALRAYHLRVNNIKVTIQLAPDLPETMADPGQLQQVFLNLVVNAETEMKLARGKGKLLIKTEKVDNTIRISFKDNGPGIAKKNLERIFDPFFTTREVGQGTGLGLSLCHGIVAEHNGKIYVESKLGKGATFIMELPVVTEAEPPKPSEPVVEQPEKVAKARILMVDDEKVIRDLVKRVLAGEGYEVETVDNAGDALKKIEGKRYNLVLIDIKMPGMDGVELYKRIQKIAKSLARRVVFITGDIMGAATEKFLSETKVAHIDKPFSAEQLKREVRRALTGGR